MAVKVVMIPVSWSLPAYAAQFAEHQGHMEQIKENRMKEAESAESELDNLLEAGFKIQSSNVLEVTHRTFVVFVLWKSSIPF